MLKIAIPFFAFVLSAFAYNTQAQVIDQKMVVEEVSSDSSDVDTNTQISVYDIDTTPLDILEAPKKKVEEPPYTSVEQMPSFPEGEKAMMKFINSNLKVPVTCPENMVEGRVVLRFVVSKDGSIRDVQILRSLSPLCDKEAVRLVESMPRWIPGMQNQKAVDVYYTLPIVFKLNQ